VPVSRGVARPVPHGRKWRGRAELWVRSGGVPDRVRAGSPLPQPSGTGRRGRRPVFRRDWLAGLVIIADEGCGHETCVVVTGETAGTVVSVDTDYEPMELGLGLVGYFRAWLEGNLARFRLVRDRLVAGEDLTAIEAAVEERLGSGSPSVGDVAVSLLGIDKPAELFGDGSRRIYFGATQRPWYEQQIRPGPAAGITVDVHRRPSRCRPTRQRRPQSTPATFAKRDRPEDIRGRFTANPDTRTFA